MSKHPIAEAIGKVVGSLIGAAIAYAASIWLMGCVPWFAGWSVLQRLALLGAARFVASAGKGKA